MSSGGRILLVGHLTIDRFEGGSRLGGSVLYIAMALAGTGHSVQVVTSGPPEGVAALRELGCRVLAQPSDVTTTFLFDDLGERRHLLCPVAAAPLRRDLLPEETWDFALLSPVAGECEADWLAPGLARHTVLNLQGWLRRFDQRRAVLPAAPPPYLHSAACEAAICSEQDAPLAALLPLLQSTRNLVVTQGERGAVLHRPEQEPCHIPTIALQVEDQVGAGDSFSAGYLLGLLQGGSPQECVRSGHASASRLLSTPRISQYLIAVAKEPS